MVAARPYHVAKFGGTSVGSPERVRRVVELVAAGPADHRRVVVVSAFGGVTDRLLAAIAEAQARTGGHEAILSELFLRHRDAFRALVPEAERDALAPTLEALFEETSELLEGVYLLRECTPRFQDAIISAGERASVPLVAAAFRAAGLDAVGLDATAFVRTDDRFGEAAVDFAETRRLVRATFDALPDGVIPVVTGFVGATAEGVTTTLGRSGSDYTATILAGALDAAACVIWTDVDGVLSADPRIAPEAFTLPALSYTEAGELAHFGAKVLHPRTMRPLQRAGIPLVIKNTLNPDHAGTRIGPPPAGEAAHETGGSMAGATGSGRASGARPGRIKAVTAVRGAALVRLDGAGVLSVADLAARAFARLADAGLEVLLVAQASSEGSLCLAVREADAEAAVRLLARAFERDLERGDLLGVSAEGGAAVVAAVGDGLHEAPGLAGRLFATLGRAHVNVRAIAQGASDHTLSAAVADADAARAVRALHEAFAMRRLRAHVAVVGAGALGRRVLDLLAARAEALRAGGLHLPLVAVADSRRLVWDEAGLDPHDALARLADAEPVALDALVERLATARLERLVVVDATPSAEVARRHPDLLRAGVAVVTPNKAATLLPAAAWQAALDAARAGEAPYLYETTVGAGLHVVATLRDLVRTGDAIGRVEGVLSGTLSFVFNALRAGASFSQAVLEARDRGYTEPDPRDDLSGRDAARKLVVLAREMGRPADAAAASAAVESLVPEGLRDVPPAEFLARLPEHDAAWADRLAAAAPAQLQYVCRLGPDGAIAAGVEPVAAGAPLADLRGPALVVAFHTARYAPEPLVVQGPGASVDVTAAVLLADVARAAEAMR